MFGPYSLYRKLKVGAVVIGLFFLGAMGAASALEPSEAEAQTCSTVLKGSGFGEFLKDNENCRDFVFSCFSAMHHERASEFLSQACRTLMSDIPSRADVPATLSALAEEVVWGVETGNEEFDDVQQTVSDSGEGKFEAGDFVLICLQAFPGKVVGCECAYPKVVGAIGADGAEIGVHGLRFGGREREPKFGSKYSKKNAEEFTTVTLNTVIECGG